MPDLVPRALPHHHPRRIFEREYAQISEQVYDDMLPPWPGIEATRGWGTLAATNWGWWTDPPQLLPFHLSTVVKTEPLAMELARHETAHVAAMLLDGHHDHGPAWHEHALRCGARPRAIVLPHEWT